MEKSAGPLLPIHAFEEEICESVKRNDAVVLIGETGSGKTTQVSYNLYLHIFDNSAPTDLFALVTEFSKVQHDCLSR
jgi:HrpA-like RNA helicase